MNYRVPTAEELSEIRTTCKEIARRHGVGLSVRKGRGSCSRYVVLQGRLDGGSAAARIAIGNALLALGFESSQGPGEFSISSHYVGLAERYNHGLLDLMVWKRSKAAA